MGKLLLVVDMAVILLVAVAFGNITTALYGHHCPGGLRLCHGRGAVWLDTAKVAYIISNFDREISEAIVQRMDRGVTILKGEGAYSGDKKRVRDVRLQAEGDRIPEGTDLRCGPQRVLSSSATPMR